MTQLFAAQRSRQQAVHRVQRVEPALVVGGMLLGVLAAQRPPLDPGVVQQLGVVGYGLRMVGP